MPPSLSIILAVFAVALVVLAAAASGFETALFSLRSHQITQIAGKNRRLGAMLRLLLRHGDENRVRILIMSAILNLTLIVVGLLLIREWEFLKPYPITAMAGVLFLIILMTDMAPKLLAFTRPAQIFEMFARPFLSVSACLAPFSAAAQAIAARIERWIVPKSFVRRASYTEDEYEALVELSKEDGTLEADEGNIIAEIVKLGNKTAKDCMTARVDAFVLPVGLKRKELLEQATSGGRWIVPLYRDTPDSVTGVLDVQVALQNSEGNLKGAIKPPVFVPETMMALRVFDDYLQKPHSMVVVLDEYGGTEGVLTHEDIIQEMIGDFAGANSTPEQEEFEFLTPNRLLATGAARLDELGDALEMDLEVDGLDTIGGLVFNRHGKLPICGERIDLGSVRVIVRRVGNKRIEELLIERMEAL